MITPAKRPFGVVYTGLGLFTHTLSWAAVPGAAHYQVWISISRADYDFTASGNLLDFYTKVAELAAPATC